MGNRWQRGLPKLAKTMAIDALNQATREAFHELASSSESMQSAQATVGTIKERPE